MARRTRSFFFDNKNRRLLINTTKKVSETVDSDDISKATVESDALTVTSASQSLTATEKQNALTNLGLTATTTELNYVDGVTSAIQTQLNTKTSYSNSNVDEHLNQSNPTSGYLLSWNGSDYAWVAPPTGFSGAYADLTGKPTIPTNNNQLTNGAGYITNSDGTEAATASTVAKRNASADINARLFRSSYANQSTISGGIAYRVNDGTDNYIRFCSDGAAIRSFIGAGTSSFNGAYSSLSGLPTLGGGTPYLDLSSANYGTVNVDDDRSVSWAGYTILNAWSLMSNGAAYSGMYDDTDNVWMTRWYRGGATELYWDGAWRLQTDSAGITVSGRVAASGDSTFAQSTHGPLAGSSSSGNVTSLEILNNGGTGDANLAAMSFHCSGTYGAHLHLRADSYFGVGGWSASTWRWYVQLSTGNMTAAGNVTAYSDPRLKENITPLTGAVEKIKKLNGMEFTWKDLPDIVGTPGARDYGVLSTEVAEVAPHAIHESPHTAPEGDTYKTVAYDKLIPLLIEAVKEQQKEIDELKAKLA